MQITVFGASGKVGRLVVAGALARGWQVVVFVHRHNPFSAAEAAGVAATGVAKAAGGQVESSANGQAVGADGGPGAAGAAEQLVVVRGEIGDRAAVERAVVGSDAVVSALGSWGATTQDILTRGMRTIIPVLEARGPRRLVTLTGAGAQWSGDTPGFIGTVSHRLLGLAAPKILQDGEEHLRLLTASQLDWTSVRAPVMTKAVRTQYRLDARSPALLASVPRLAVAQALLDQIEAGHYHRQAPFIHRAKR